MTLRRSLKGQVSLEYGNLWVLHDPDEAPLELPPDDLNLSGPGVEDGAYFLSGHFAPILDVVIEIHDSDPGEVPPERDSVTYVARFPSRKAWAYSAPIERLPDRSWIEDIELPAERLVVRATAACLESEEPSDENWVIQVWPA